MALDWLRRDNELKDHTLLGEEHFGTVAPSVIYERRPIIDPQGPTELRGVMELAEELALRGGGIGLFTGCAAGDSAMAVVLRVSEAAH